MSLSRSSLPRLLAAIAVGGVILAGCGSSETTPNENPSAGQTQSANDPTGDTETLPGGVNVGEGDTGSTNGEKDAEGEYEDMELPPRSEYEEDIELARKLTVEEIEAHNNARVDALNDEYNELTKNEYEIFLKDLEEVEAKFLPDFEALDAEHEQAIEDLGGNGTPDELESITIEFGNRRAELRDLYEEEFRVIHQRFMDDTESQRLEFEPRFIDQNARYTYMLEVAKDN